MIIPAYLESTVIGTKVREIARSFAQSEVSGRVIVVASDAATARAAEHAGSDLVLRTGRLGKAAAINHGVAHSEATVIAFSDANCRVEPVDWYRILRDDLEQADLVSAQKTESGGSEGSLRVLDALVRRSGSGVHESAAVYGEFVAMRRSDFEPLPEDVILDDVALGLSFGRRHLRVVVDERIRTVESAPPPREQWGRRVRIAEGLLGESVPDIARLLRFPAGRVFTAHKIVRVTLSCAAFWTTLVSAAVAVPPVSLVVVPLMVISVLGYAGRIRLPHWIRSLVAPIGMQAVPLVALRIVLRRRFGRGRPSAGALWEKIQR